MRTLISSLFLSAAIFTGCASEQQAFSDTSAFDTGWAEIDSNPASNHKLGDDIDISASEDISNGETIPLFDESGPFYDTISEEPIDDLQLF